MAKGFSQPLKPIFPVKADGWTLANRVRGNEEDHGTRDAPLTQQDQLSSRVYATGRTSTSRLRETNSSKRSSHWVKDYQQLGTADEPNAGAGSVSDTRPSVESLLLKPTIKQIFDPTGDRFSTEDEYPRYRNGKELGSTTQNIENTGKIVSENERGHGRRVKGCSALIRNPWRYLIVMLLLCLSLSAMIWIHSRHHKPTAIDLPDARNVRTVLDHLAVVRQDPTIALFLAENGLSNTSVASGLNAELNPESIENLFNELRLLQAYHVRELGPVLATFGLAQDKRLTQTMRLMVEKATFAWVSSSRTANAVAEVEAGLRSIHVSITTVLDTCNVNATEASRRPFRAADAAGLAKSIWNQKIDKVHTLVRYRMVLHVNETVTRFAGELQQASLSLTRRRTDLEDLSMYLKELSGRCRRLLQAEESDRESLTSEVMLTRDSILPRINRALTGLG